MRHTVTLEFLEEIEVHEKLTYFNAISTAKGLSYTDIASASRDEVITAYFSTDDGDKGRIIFEKDVMKISTLFSFEKLIALNEFTEVHYGELVLDLLEAETNPDYPPVEEEEETPPIITA